MIRHLATEGQAFDQAVAQLQRDWEDIGQIIAAAKRALNEVRSIHEQSHRAGVAGPIATEHEATLAERPRIGAELCALCRHEILRVSDLAKGALAAKVAVLHRRCYGSLGQGPQKRAGRKPAR